MNFELSLTHLLGTDIRNHSGSVIWPICQPISDGYDLHENCHLILWFLFSQLIIRYRAWNSKIILNCMKSVFCILKSFDMFLFLCACARLSQHARDYLLMTRYHFLWHLNNKTMFLLQLVTKSLTFLHLGQGVLSSYVCPSVCLSICPSF